MWKFYAGANNYYRWLRVAIHSFFFNFPVSFLVCVWTFLALFTQNATSLKLLSKGLKCDLNASRGLKATRHHITISSITQIMMMLLRQNSFGLVFYFSAIKMQIHFMDYFSKTFFFLCFWDLEMFKMRNFDWIIYAFVAHNRNQRIFFLLAITRQELECQDNQILHSVVYTVSMYFFFVLKGLNEVFFNYYFKKHLHFYADSQKWICSKQTNSYQKPEKIINTFCFFFYHSTFPSAM